MRYFIFILSLVFVTNLYAEEVAGRVAIQKSTGKLIQFQSKGRLHKGLIADAIGKPFKELTQQEITEGINIVNARRLDTLRQNALNNGYDENDIEVKFVTDSEWKDLREEWILKPGREKRAQKEAEKQAKEETLKSKFGWTDEDLENIKAVLK